MVLNAFAAIPRSALNLVWVSIRIVHSIFLHIMCAISGSVFNSHTFTDSASFEDAEAWVLAKFLVCFALGTDSNFCPRMLEQHASGGDTSLRNAAGDDSAEPKGAVWA